MHCVLMNNLLYLIFSLLVLKKGASGYMEDFVSAVAASCAADTPAAVRRQVGAPPSFLLLILQLFGCLSAFSPAQSACDRKKRWFKRKRVVPEGPLIAMKSPAAHSLSTRPDTHRQDISCSTAAIRMRKFTQGVFHVASLYNLSHSNSRP